ncbi:hypothetical protein I4U23_005135 [Adineta vaga]|nr:hypothetical protein I4U23_005135 [Adineta vaga]
MNLLDLPNEILLYILAEMNVVDALFRQSGLNRRLDQLLFNSIYVRELDFTIKSWDNSISPINDLKILPRIIDKIIKLIPEPYAIERVLNSTIYPKVSSLSLLNFRSEILLQHLTKNDILIELIRQQITHLYVNTTDETNEELRLVITVPREDTYQVTDGNNLYTDILIHLSQLKSFRFIANDYVPWEKNFLKKIAQCFPFIETLLIVNSKPQENKSQLSKEAEKLELTTFTRLFELRVALAHMNYVEQLLFNRCIHLPRLRILEM